MNNKAEDLLNKVEELREDMIKYLKEYVFPQIKGQILLKYEIKIPFSSDYYDDIKWLQVYQVDDECDLWLVFEYEDAKNQAEDVDVESLRFEALCELIGFYHDTFE